MCQQRTLLRRGDNNRWPQAALARGQVVHSRCVGEVWGWAGCGLQGDDKLQSGGPSEGRYGHAAMAEVWEMLEPLNSARGITTRGSHPLLGAVL